MPGSRLYRFEVALLIFAALMVTPVPDLIRADQAARDAARAATYRCQVYDCAELENWITTLEGFEKDYIDWINWATTAGGMWKQIAIGIGAIHAALGAFFGALGTTESALELILDLLASRGVGRSSLIVRALQAVKSFAARVSGGAWNFIKALARRALAALISLWAEILAGIVVAFEGFVAGMALGLYAVQAELLLARAALKKCKEEQAKQIQECYRQASAVGVGQRDVRIERTLPYPYSRADIVAEQLQRLVDDLYEKLVLPTYFNTIGPLINELRAVYQAAVAGIARLNQLIGWANSVLRWLVDWTLPSIPLPGGFSLPPLPAPGPLRR
ncbi:MAG: hypothetical protein L6Q98_12430 [Anaerolineae bacterium]|nr:hypothetical protein [Anaerolineae bacterium]NUQ04578.1 hypothetical protein [Anaerolineae bacterium]